MSEAIEYFRPKTVQILRTLAKNRVWLVDNMANLKREYPDEYVAVHGGSVVGHNKNVNDLKSSLREQFGEIDHIAISFIISRKIRLILAY